MRHLARSVLIFALVVMFAAVPAGAVADPVRVLVLLGGEHHPYEAGSRLLLEAAGKSIEIEADYVRLDSPPPGRPRAEKATVVSNPAVLESRDLAEKYDVILAYHQNSWINLTPAQARGYLDFVRKGGGLVAIHSTCEPIMSDPQYVRMIGARFRSHEPFATVTVEKAPGVGSSPLLDGVADKFDIKDELYHVEEPTGVQKRVLQVARSREDGTTRPVTWIKTFGQGRVFCTVLGHSLESLSNPNLQRLIQNGLVWASSARKDAGFVPLFDGKSLEGWKHVGPGGFKVVNGVLQSYGGMGLLWYSKKKFRDFVLRVEWRVNKKSANSGVFLRFPNPPRTPMTAVNEGYEVQIADTNGPKRNTGSIFDFKAATKVASKPPGQWNMFEITVVGQKYTVVLNGEKVNEFVGERGREGYIGLQNHDADSIVSYRRIEIKELGR